MNAIESEHIYILLEEVSATVAMYKQMMDAMAQRLEGMERKMTKLNKKM